ncbi:MAG: iron-containing alcohol dehydrogenase, partial [Treponema sp.]|nr:iron-containing alcohol dehydrogenase [Treponema sp.]
IKPNPELSKVYEGINLVREKQPAFVLAIGGGSVIDTAKAIAAGVPYGKDVWDLYTRKGTFHSALPTGALVTIPASGSESSNGSVITNEKTKQKLAIIDDCLRPVFAILNPELTFSLPPYQTFCGIVDIMSHVLERYFSRTTHTDLTDRMCEALLKTVIHNAQLLPENPKDYNARAEIMLASTIAHGDLLGAGRTQDWGSHYIGMELSAIYGSTHGATLSVITPAWAKYVHKEYPARFIQFAVRVFGIDYDFMDPINTAMEGIIALEDFFKRLGVPTVLEEIGVTDDSKFEEMADKYLSIGPYGDIKKLTKEDFINILKLARRKG